MTPTLRSSPPQPGPALAVLLTRIGIAQPSTADWLRLPGLFRRWELSDVIAVGEEFLVQEAGHAADGTQLFALYTRPRAAAEVAP